jgi:hypothetical protein
MKAAVFAALSALEGATLVAAATAHASSRGFFPAAVVEALGATALLGGAGFLAIRWRRRWQSAAVAQGIALACALGMIGIRATSIPAFSPEDDLLHQVMLVALLAGFLLTCRNLRLTGGVYQRSRSVR